MHPLAPFAAAYTLPPDNTTPPHWMTARIRAGSGHWNPYRAALETHDCPQLRGLAAAWDAECANLQERYRRSPPSDGERRRAPLPNDARLRAVRAHPDAQPLFILTDRDGVPQTSWEPADVPAVYRDAMMECCVSLAEDPRRLSAFAYISGRKPRG